MRPARKHRRCGFTLIELLVTLAVIALLLTLVVPRYFQRIELAKEAVLQENLRTTREVIDKFYADTGRYPDSLEELVEKRYLRSLPVDPLTDDSSSWSFTAPPSGIKGRIYNIRSGAVGTSSNGKSYADY